MKDMILEADGTAIYLKAYGGGERGSVSSCQAAHVLLTGNV